MSKKFQISERGAAHILLIGLIVLIIAGIAAAGYIVAGKSSGSPKLYTTATNAAAAVAASSRCMAAYHDSTLCKFAGNANAFDKTAYTATLNVVQSGATSTMALASDGKGNSKLATTAGSQAINSVTLHGITYIQSSGSGPWIEYPSGASAPTYSPTSTMNIGVGTAGITFKALGTQACSNMTCYKYQVIDSASPNTKQYVLFDNSSYKLREWQYTDASGYKTTMDVSYGSVNIVAPSPVESLSQAQ